MTLLRLYGRRNNPVPVREEKKKIINGIKWNEIKLGKGKSVTWSLTSGAPLWKSSLSGGGRKVFWIWLFTFLQKLLPQKKKN